MLFQEVIKLPLSLEQLQVVLANKSKEPVTTPKAKQPIMAAVSYKESTLKNMHFVNYVSNLNLSIGLIQEDLTKEERFDLLKFYLNSRVLSQIDTLATETIMLLLHKKNSIVTDPNDFLSPEERVEFISANDEVLTRYELFLESILIGLPFVIKEYAATVGKDLIESKEIPVVSDPGFISSNVVSLIMQDGFLEFYLSHPTKHKLVLFESQWFEPVFNGQNLINIVTGHSSLFPFMQALHDNWFSPEELENIKVS